VEKTVLITGSTDGIGLQTAIELYSRGFHVVVHGRNKGRIHEALKAIEQTSSGGSLSSVQADFSSLAEVRSMSEEIRRQFIHLDVLINNAGVFQSAYEQSDDGIEMTFAVNHLAPFLLTNLLLDLLKAPPESRIITVSSMIHARQIDFENLQGEGGFDAGGAYSLSKLCNILFTYKLSRMLRGLPVTVNCLHPGVINTKLLRVAWSSMGASPAQGARTPVYLASSSEVNGVTGSYFVNMSPQESAAVSYDTDTQDRLWRISEELVGLT
jgi:NAD(P)-dependent dehydrogenase (short-subunit alcohol dehydrogenase family)